MVRPEASRPSSSASSQASRASVATTALVRYGTGATARPSSSSTTATSRAEAPWPPRSSGTRRPARPMPSASSFHRARSCGASDSARVITPAGGQ